MPAAAAISTTVPGGSRAALGAKIDKTPPATNFWAFCQGGHRFNDGGSPAAPELIIIGIWRHGN
jgi:hypothetical protein